MSSPAANEGAYSYREQQFRALANGPQMYSSGPGPSSSPDRMPARRGGLNAEPESMTAAGGQQYSYNNHHQLQQQQQQPQYQQRHQPIHHSHSYPQAHQLTHSREGATSAAATAATTTTSSAGRDRNPDRNPDNHLSKHREASLPGNLQSTYSSADDNDSLPPICPPQLQIRFTPHSRQGSVASHSRQGSVTGLQIKTDIPSASASPARPAVNHTHISTPSIPIPGSSSLSTVDSASHSLTPTTDLRKAISAASLNSSLSPSGGLGSPYLSAMVDITPLPSPIMPGELSPVPWKRIRENEQRNRSRERSTTPGATQESGASTPPPRYNLPISPDSPPRKQRGYGSLMTAAIEARAAAAIQENALAHDQNSTHLLQQPHAAHGHARNRSISDFKPEQLQNTRPRNVTINYTAGPPGEVQHQPMHREQYLAAQRGLLNAINPLPPPAHTLPDPTKALPSPPPSNKSVTGSEMDEEDLHTRSRPSSSQHSPLAQLHTEQTQQEADADDANAEYFLVRETNNPSKKRKWRALRPLGQGTFSKVILATSERLPARIPYDDENLDPAKLVAIKIVEHGPAGGADEERIEVSLKREVDILKSIRHPCIVQLKAMEYTDDRALLVLTFCPGGDLFDLASHRRDLLTKDMVQRIFGEVLSAVRWLHEHGVVHRDLKLESMLFIISFFLADTLLVCFLLLCYILIACVDCCLILRSSFYPLFSKCRKKEKEFPHTRLCTHSPLS